MIQLIRFKCKCGKEGFKSLLVESKESISNKCADCMALDSKKRFNDMLNEETKKEGGVVCDGKRKE